MTREGSSATRVPLPVYDDVSHADERCDVARLTDVGNLKRWFAGSIGRRVRPPGTTTVSDRPLLRPSRQPRHGGMLMSKRASSIEDFVNSTTIAAERRTACCRLVKT